MAAVVVSQRTLVNGGSSTESNRISVEIRNGQWTSVRNPQKLVVCIIPVHSSSRYMSVSECQNLKDRRGMCAPGMVVSSWPQFRKNYNTPCQLFWVILRVGLTGELFFQILDSFFAQFFNLPYFPVLFFSPNIGMLSSLIFLVQENFTNSDRKPPYIDPYLQLFPNFGNYGKNALR